MSDQEEVIATTVDQESKEATIEVTTAEALKEAKAAVKELTPEQLYDLQVAANMANLGNWKKRVSGFAKFLKPAKLSKSWHNGKLMLTSERNKLPQEEILASNNVIRKAKRG